MRELRLGTRGSQLALWQARAVAARIRAAGGPACRIEIIRTSGDRLQEAPLSEIGGKRLFVKEIEDALLRHDIDLAVHSSKDMPAVLPAGLAIAAVLPREDPLDAIVLPETVRLKADTTPVPPDATLVGSGFSRTDTDPTLVASGFSRTNTDPTPVASGFRRTDTDPTLVASAFGRTNTDPTLVASGFSRTDTVDHLVATLGQSPNIGTGSVRRIAQLIRLMPGARFAPIRGNLDTRLRKLDGGEYDALVLAAAGLRRLGFASRISTTLPQDACVPAPGQGIVAIEMRASDHENRRVVAAIDDPAAAAALAAERALVAALGGGCQTPIGALASPIDRDSLELVAVVVSLDGSRAVRAHARGPMGSAGAIGERVARQLLDEGAHEILADVRKAQGAVEGIQP